MMNRNCVVSVGIGYRYKVVEAYQCRIPLCLFCLKARNDFYLKSFSGGMTRTRSYSALKSRTLRATIFLQQASAAAW